MQHAHVLGQAEGDEVRDAKEGEDEGQQRQSRRRGLEAARVRQAHGLADHVDQRLLGDGGRVGQEEEAQGDVEEGQGGDDGLGRYERHDVGDELASLPYGRLRSESKQETPAAVDVGAAAGRLDEARRDRGRGRRIELRVGIFCSWGFFEEVQSVPYSLALSTLARTVVFDGYRC